jgi:transposase
MLNALADHTKIYMACGYTDLRKQIDGLAAIVVEVFGQDPCQANALYLLVKSRMLV